MSLVGFRAQNHPQQVLVHTPRSHVDDRATTPEVFDPLHERYRFTLDVAAAPHNAKLERFYTIEDDGLEQSWEGERVFCNPPYSNIAPWVQKAWESRAELVVMCQPHGTGLVARARRAATRSTRRGAVRVPARAAALPEARAEAHRPERATPVRVLLAGLGCRCHPAFTRGGVSMPRATEEGDMPDESAATGRELREADTTFRPRIYCAVVQPPEGGAPVTAVTTVHKDDYDEALSRIAELTDQLVAATDARDRYGALLGEIKVAMDAQIGGGTGPDPIAVANTIRRTLRRTNAR